MNYALTNFNSVQQQEQQQQHKRCAAVGVLKFKLAPNLTDMSLNPFHQPASISLSLTLALSFVECVITN